MPIRTCLIVLLGLCCIACGSTAPPTRGELQPLETACDRANEGKRIAVEGYLTLPDQISGDFSVVLRIHSTPERTARATVSTTVRVDPDRKAPNTIDNLGTRYSDADLTIRTADGQTLGYQDNVRVSGTVYFPSSTAAVEFTCGLDNPLIEQAK